MRNTLTSVLILLMLLNGSANSESGKSQLPHIHGQANLTLVTESNDLEIQFESPSANIVGFEHKARTKKDIAAVEKAALLLSDPDTLFSISAGRCKLVNSTIDVSGIINSYHDDLELPAKSVESKNEHNQKDNHAQQGNHSEIIANFHYNCERISEFSVVTVTLFEMFPDIHQIRAMWIIESRQGAVSLNTEDKTIRLK